MENQMDKATEPKIINEPDMWCPKCENHELKVTGSDVLPIYECTKCGNLMWQVKEQTNG